MVFGALWDLELGGRTWSVDASYTYSEHDTATTQSQDTLSAQMELAINGLGGPNCDVVNGTPGSGNLYYQASNGQFVNPAGAADNCYYFNPFGNSLLARDGTDQTDLSLVNPAELYDYLLGRVTSDVVFTQEVVDVVAGGELLDTSAGPVGIALGLQRRSNEGAAVFDGATKSNNLDFAYGVQDWAGGLTTTAFFVELGVPIHETFELNLAARYENFDEIDEDTVDPKITALWRPIDDLSIRLSGGRSFKSPSIQQLYGAITTVHNLADTGLGGTAFRPALSVGNENLKPERADSYNIGFSWVPSSGSMEGFEAHLDYYQYAYTDILTRENHNTLLADDLKLLNDYKDANGGTLLDAINAGAGIRDQVIRNPTGGLLRLLPRFVNANSADIGGIDLTTSYSLNNRLGNWKIGLQMSFINEYEVEIENRFGGVTVVDAVGEYNDTNPVARPLPEWKANATLNWSRCNHRAFLLVKHVDGVNHNLTSGATFFAETAKLAHGADFAADFLDSSVDAWTTADVNYTYTFGEAAFVSSTSVTLGIQNITNEEPPFVPVITGYDGTMHDPRVRLLFIRAMASM